MSLRTVQRFFRQFPSDGEAACQNHYHQCGKNQPQQTSQQIVQTACDLRRTHPTWGAQMVLLEMEESQEEAAKSSQASKEKRVPLPSVRTVQRHFQKQGLNTPPSGRPRKKSARYVPLASEPHAGWQIDASENIRLKNGQEVCWLQIVDEGSGAFLDTTVFPTARWEQVDRLDIQKTLRARFAVWGRPERLRMDNGYPWNSSGDFPSEMALWLIGLAVKPLWIPPHSPQHNGMVEKSQGTGKSWADPSQCESAAALQRNLTKMNQRQREQYPLGKAKKTRLERYPELKHSGREYSLAWEDGHWDLELVLNYFVQEGLVSVRQVPQGGQISLYNGRRYYVGRRYAGQTVYISLDPEGPHWRFESAQGALWKSIPAAELTADRIRNLAVTHRVEDRQGKA